MKLSRIKTVVIFVLVALNALFLSVYFAERANDNRINRRALEDIKKIYAENNVAILFDSVPRVRSVNTVALSGDAVGRRAIAEFLLGEVEESTSPGVKRYESGRGTAEFKNTGEIEIIFNGGAFTNEDRRRTVKKILKAMSAEEYRLLETESGITVTHRYKGRDIAGRKLVFVFSEEGLEKIDGVLYNTFKQNDENSLEITPESALLRLLNHIMESGAGVDKVSDMELCYIASLTLFGDGKLQPCWSFDVGGEKIYMHGATGEILYIT